MNPQTAEEVMELIDQMDAAEKWKLLSMLFDAYYNSQGLDLTANHDDVLEY